MGKKSIAALSLLIISLVALYLLWPSDEARIRKLIKEVAEAVEQEDIEGVMSKVSLNYSDDLGLSYMLLKKSIEGQFRVLSDMEVEYEALKIEVEDGSATARMDVRVIATLGRGGGQRGYFWGDLDEPLRLMLELEKNPVKQWRVLKVAGFSGLIP